MQKWASAGVALLQRGARCTKRILSIRTVTQPPLESYLNWVPDPMPTAIRRHDLTSPAPVPSENTPPSDVLRKLPRLLRPRRHRGKQPTSSTNENSASRVADPATPLGPSANENSTRLAPSAATRPRSMANSNSPFPGPQPGTSQSPRSAFMKHPQSFQSSQMSQHPRSAANENADCRFRLDHSEIWGIYKPARNSTSQDSPASRRRDTFSGFGLSSPALQQPTHKPFSGSPPGALMTDPQREAGEAGRLRPGIVYPLPRAARPDTRLSIDAAPPEAAALSSGDRPPTVVDIPETRPVGGTRLQGPSQPRGSRSSRRQSRKPNGHGIAPLGYTGRRSALHTEATGVNRLLYL